MSVGIGMVTVENTLLQSCKAIQISRTSNWESPNAEIIGDAVNVASRVETACKQVGWPILLTQTTATACKAMALLEAGSITLKGKAQPATLYALVGDETLARTKEWQALERRHKELIEGRTRVASRAEIERLVNACLAVAPVDLSAFYDSFMPSPIIEELAGE